MQSWTQGSAMAPRQQHMNSWDPAAFPWGLCRIIQFFLEPLLQQLPETSQWSQSQWPQKFSAEHLILHLEAHLLLAESPSLQPLRAGAAYSAGIYHKCMGGPRQMSSDNEDTARHPMLCLQGASTAQIHLTDPRK